MKSLPSFNKAVQELVRLEADNAYTHIEGGSGEYPFSSRWICFNALSSESLNWYGAIGGFSYSVTGKVIKTTVFSGGLIDVASKTIEYKVHLFDRYNFNKDGSFSNPFYNTFHLYIDYSFTFRGHAYHIHNGVSKCILNRPLSNLHPAGLAREYTIRGSSSVLSSTCTIEGGPCGEPLFPREKPCSPKAKYGTECTCCDESDMQGNPLIPQDQQCIRAFSNGETCPAMNAVQVSNCGKKGSATAGECK